MSASAGITVITGRQQFLKNASSLRGAWSQQANNKSAPVSEFLPTTSRNLVPGPRKGECARFALRHLSKWSFSDN